VHQILSELAELVDDITNHAQTD